MTQIFDSFIELFNKIKSALSEHKTLLLDFVNTYASREKKIVDEIITMKQKKYKTITDDSDILKRKGHLQ